MAKPTIEQLDTDISALKRERDLIMLDGTKEVQAALRAGKVATLAEDLEALQRTLSTESVAYQQVRNVVTVLRNVRRLIDSEVDRIGALAQQPAPEPPTLAAQGGGNQDPPPPNPK